MKKQKQSPPLGTESYLHVWIGVKVQVLTNTIMPDPTGESEIVQGISYRGVFSAYDSEFIYMNELTLDPKSITITLPKKDIIRIEVCPPPSDKKEQTSPTLDKVH